MTDAPSGPAGERPAAKPAAPPACPYCGGATEAERGRMTLWLGERLVVIEDVPTRACTGCGERFYRDDVLTRVERLQTAEPDGPAPVRTVEAPVYAWTDL